MIITRRELAMFPLVSLLLPSEPAREPADGGPSEKCGNCRFFKHRNNDAGRCQRFPRFEQRKRSEWCGEWRGIEK